jgi:hypothetical protein
MRVTELRLVLRLLRVRRNRRFDNPFLESGDRPNLRAVFDISGSGYILQVMVKPLSP